jgi:fibro-slime domain-containing protein
MNPTRSKVLGVLALVVAAGGAAGLAGADGAAGPTNDPYANLPGTISLNGVIRDFRAAGQTGGHPDFELNPSGGFGHYVGLVQDQLDSQGKPVFASAGYKVSSQWRDSAGRNRIRNRSYIAPQSGDVNGAQSSSTGGCATNADRMAQWFRDVPGVNLSRNLALTLVRQPNSNVYTFNDRTDAMYANRGGFFPVNGELYGNYTSDKNFHFTYELATTFVYQSGQGQVFTFTGDDDVWVFIDGKLVIDLGGIHGATSQTIELDRLTWLQSGHEYDLRFFFAERHTTQSNFRIDTTMFLRTIDPPSTSSLFD